MRLDLTEMTTGVLEFNDVGLRYYDTGKLLIESPGYAFIDKGALLFGADAKAQAKLHPTKTNHQFWQQLNLTPITASNKAIRHHADLAYQHILSLLTENTINPDNILAVPGSFSKEQLALLLGIVQAANLPIHGVVDSATLACQHLLAPGTYVHIDLQLHQTVISEIIVGKTIQRHAIEILGATGLVNFSDAWAQGVTDQFIQQTRFNPLHGAESEQQLHNQLFSWLEQCTHAAGDGSLRIQLNNREITLLSAPVLEKTEPLYRRIVERVQQRFGKTDNIILSDRFAALPSATNTLAEFFTLEALTAGQLVSNLQASLATLGEQTAQTFITQLNLTDKSQGASTPHKETQRLSSAVQATHLLKGCSAFRLNNTLIVDTQGDIVEKPQSNMVLKIEKQTHQIILTPMLKNAVYLNEKALQHAQAVQTGDVITLAEHPDIKFYLIAESSVLADNKSHSD